MTKMISCAFRNLIIFKKEIFPSLVLIPKNHKNLMKERFGILIFFKKSKHFKKIYEIKLRGASQGLKRIPT